MGVVANLIKNIFTCEFFRNDLPAFPELRPTYPWEGEETHGASPASLVAGLDRCNIIEITFIYVYSVLWGRVVHVGFNDVHAQRRNDEILFHVKVVIFKVVLFKSKIYSCYGFSRMTANDVPFFSQMAISVKSKRLLYFHI